MGGCGTIAMKAVYGAAAVQGKGEGGRVQWNGIVGEKIMGLGREWLHMRGWWMSPCLGLRGVTSTIIDVHLYH